MLGGLYKKTTYLNEYRKTQKNLIVIDSGDLLNELPEIKDSIISSSRLKADLIAKINKDIGIDAINVGELELALGLDFIKELQKKYDIPFISANIVDDKNQPLFDPYVIKKVDGLKIGIVGIMGNTPDVSKKMKQIASSLSVLDPVKTATAMVAELKDKVDYVIVMTHQHMGRNWIVAKKIEGVDLVVGGHHKQKLKTPYKANDTYIVQSGEKGQHQGMFEVEIAADGTKTVTNTLVPFGAKIADDKKVKAMIDEYNQSLQKIYNKGSVEKEGVVIPRSMTCNDCHDEAYESWTKTDHAKAFQTLVDKGRQFDPYCLKCHTTRFEEPGGFSMTAQEKELRNIQCEECHGDASAHLEDPESVPQGNPGKEACIVCHTEDRCPDFEKNYTQEWEKIKH